MGSASAPDVVRRQEERTMTGRIVQDKYVMLITKFSTKLGLVAGLRLGLIRLPDAPAGRATEAVSLAQCAGVGHPLAVRMVTDRTRRNGRGLA